MYSIYTFDVLLRKSRLKLSLGSSVCWHLQPLVWSRLWWKESLKLSGPLPPLHGPPYQSAEVAGAGQCECLGICRVRGCAASRGTGCEASGRLDLHQFLLPDPQISLEWLLRKPERERGLFVLTCNTVDFSASSHVLCSALGNQMCSVKRKLHILETVELAFLLSPIL